MAITTDLIIYSQQPRSKSKKSFFPKPLIPISKKCRSFRMEKNVSSSKPGARHDLEGNLLKEYPSIKAASRELHLDEKAIIQVAKGKYKQWKGFVWKYIS